MKPRIIGLCGAAGAGKDTVGTFLRLRHGYRRAAFADPIREMLRALLKAGGLSDFEITYYMTDREAKEQPIPGLGVSYRHMAQTLGTEWGRAVKPTLWLDVALAHIAAAPQASFVFTDVRFPNEAEWIKAHGGELWRVERPVSAVREHISEQLIGQLTADRVVDNSGTVAELQKIIADVMWDRR